MQQVAALLLEARSTPQSTHDSVLASPFRGVILIDDEAVAEGRDNLDGESITMTSSSSDDRLPPMMTGAL